MMTKIRKHTGYYLVLLVILSFGLYLLGINAHDVQGKMTIVVLLTFFYIIWGLLHHHIHHDVTAKIVLEYVLIGAIGISVIFFLLK